MSRIKKTKKPWPTREAMSQVYELNLWGGDSGKYYSGEGSHDLEIVNVYVEALSQFLSSFESKPIVCDLGCGDFNIGKQLVSFSEKYIAVDIVEKLIEYNTVKFQNDSVEFHCLDIAKDELPVGDVAIVRQVLQHISNKEVESVLKKLASYKYVVLTEHVPFGDFVPNIDIISGQGIRLKKKSGLNVLASPFNFKIKEKKKIHATELKNNQGIIETYVYTL